VASYPAEERRGWNCSWSLQEPGIETRKRRKKIEADAIPRARFTWTPQVILFCAKMPGSAPRERRLPLRKKVSRIRWRRQITQGRCPAVQSVSGLRFCRAEGIPMRPKQRVRIRSATICGRSYARDRQSYHWRERRLRSIRRIGRCGRGRRGRRNGSSGHAFHAASENERGRTRTRRTRTIIFGSTSGWTLALAS